MTVRLVLLVIFIILNGCTSRTLKDSGPTHSIDVTGIPDAVPHDEPLSKGGNPSSYVVFGKRYYVLESAKGFKEEGIASWYGNKFHGNKTSSGEIYDMYAMTAAHKELPLPSYVRVTNLNNDQSVVVRVNDRGPFHKGRIIDLSFVAASKLGIDKLGTAPVKIVAISFGDAQPSLTASRQGESIAVQIGAFAIRGSAEKVRRELMKLLNTEINISEVYRKGEKLFRVRLGPFDNIDTARNWLYKLERLSFGQPSLVYLD